MFENIKIEKLSCIFQAKSFWSHELLNTEYFLWLQDEVEENRREVREIQSVRRTWPTVGGFEIEKRDPQTLE